jgi:murein DD-endopeptidase MepM/ murein hydrolase activator NlpD
VTETITLAPQNGLRPNPPLADVTEVSKVAGVKSAGRWFVLLLVAALVAEGVPALAASSKTAVTSRQQRQTEISKRITTLRSQVQEASAEEAALLDQLDAVEAKRKDLDAKVAALDAQVGAAQAELDGASGRLDELANQLAAAQTQLTEARRLMTDARRRLADRAVKAYMGQPDMRVAERFMQPGSQREMVAAEAYVHTLVQAQQDLVDQYNAQKNELEVRQADVQTRRDAAQAQRDVVAHRAAEVASARKVQASARAEVLSQENQKQGLVAQVRSRRRDFETQIAQLRAESNAITSFLQGVQKGQGPAISGRGIFASPIPGAAITSGFGPRVHPVYGDMRMHTGIDFQASMGTPVRAAGAGTIVSAGWRGGYGNCIIIDHGNSLATLYGHLSAINVNVGDRVSKGQFIGRAGSTGMSTGPHLHFEVRANGVPVNPMGYL